MPCVTDKVELSRRFLQTFDPTSADTFWDSRVVGFGLRTRRGADQAGWRWVLRYRVGGRGSAQPRLSKPFSDATPEKARQWAERERALRSTPDGQREKAQAARAAAAAEKAEPTCARLWEEFLAAEGAAKKSARSDAQRWRDHLAPVFGARKVRDVKPADVERFKAGMAALPGACNRSVALLSRLFTLAVLWGYRPGCAPEHPVRGVSRFAEKPSEFFYSEAELGRILDAADADENRAGGLAIRMLALTGGRASEVATAHWGQIAFLPDGGAEWTVESSNTKAGRPITRYLDPNLAGRLKAWRPVALSLQARLHGHLWLFPQQPDPGQPMRRLQHVWDRVVERAGVQPGRIHDLRHTVATLARRKGWSLDAIQEQLGHATILTTRRYAHTMRDGVVEMGAMLGGLGSGGGAQAQVRPLR